MRARANFDGVFLLSNMKKSHFNGNEFACADGCGRDDVDQTLIDNLEKLRERLGEPIFISSGVRCPNHNKNVGGVKASWHQQRDPDNPKLILAQNDYTGYSYAADISCRNHTPSEVFAIAKKMKLFTGLGRYRGFTHVDTRPGEPVEWEA
jgi:uncharacterized protein YcbK (DUF882 family)